MTMKFTFVSPTNLTIEFSGKASLSPSDVENLIKQLALFRKDMKPETPRTLPDGEHSDFPIDPIWTVIPQPLSQSVLMGIRHDGLGWLLSLIPKEQAQKLGNALLAGSQSLGQPFSQNPSRH